MALREVIWVEQDDGSLTARSGSVSIMVWEGPEGWAWWVKVAKKGRVRIRLSGDCAGRSTGKRRAEAAIREVQLLLRRNKV